MTDVRPASTAASHVPGRRLRAGIVVLLAGTVLFGLGQVVHGPEVSPADLDAFVTAMTTQRLAFAHTLLAVAVMLLAVGTASLYALLSSSRAERVALGAFLSTLTGAALVVFGLGAATLAYPDVAAAHVDAPAIIGAVLDGSTRALAVVFAGAALLAIGGVLVAISVWRSDRMARSRGVPYALTVPLVLATETAPTWVKYLVAVIVTSATAWLAVASWRLVPGREPA
ncbi:hypothetical protein [Egicoccus sp. AB-alg2]|uniref:hypothetical protein n=1 Tax=Egicoccus sp. AB-alg2 TaxID=3242693 RepID=UPI00359D736A